MSFLKALLTAVVAISISATTFAAPRDKVYTIAVDPAYPPFSFKKDGKFVGIEIDLIKAIAKNQGFKYELKFMNFDGVIPGLVSGQIDGAIDGINVSEERKRVVDFSDGYFQSGLCIVMRDDFERNIKTVDDLDGLTAAVKKGTYGMEFAEKNKDRLNLNLNYFLQTSDAVFSVKNKNSDFFFEDFPVISYQIKIKEHEGLRIVLKNIYGSPTYSFAVKKGKNKALLKMFNRGLANLKKNGTYDAILNKYL